MSKSKRGRDSSAPKAKAEASLKPRKARCRVPPAKCGQLLEIVRAELRSLGVPGEKLGDLPTVLLVVEDLLFLSEKPPEKGPNRGVGHRLHINQTEETSWLGKDFAELLSRACYGYIKVGGRYRLQPSDGYATLVPTPVRADSSRSIVAAHEIRRKAFIVKLTGLREKAEAKRAARAASARGDGVDPPEGVDGISAQCSSHAALPKAAVQPSGTDNEYCAIEAACAGLTISTAGAEIARAPAEHSDGPASALLPLPPATSRPSNSRHIADRQAHDVMTVAWCLSISQLLSNLHRQRNQSDWLFQLVSTTSLELWRSAERPRQADPFVARKPVRESDDCTSLVAFVRLARSATRDGLPGPSPSLARVLAQTVPTHPRSLPPPLAPQSGRPPRPRSSRVLASTAPKRHSWLRALAAAVIVVLVGVHWSPAPPSPSAARQPQREIVCLKPAPPRSASESSTRSSEPSSQTADALSCPPDTLQQRVDPIAQKLESLRNAVEDMRSRADGMDLHVLRSILAAANSQHPERYFYVWGIDEEIRGDCFFHPVLQEMSRFQLNAFKELSECRKRGGRDLCDRMSSALQILGEEDALTIEKLIERSRRGGGPEIYFWHNPSSQRRERKFGYVVPIRIEGVGMALLGAGFYLESA